MVEVTETFQRSYLVPLERGVLGAIADVENAARDGVIELDAEDFKERTVRLNTGCSTDGVVSGVDVSLYSILPKKEEI